MKSPHSSLSAHLTMTVVAVTDREQNTILLPGRKRVEWRSPDHRNPQAAMGWSAEAAGVGEDGLRDAPEGNLTAMIPTNDDDAVDAGKKGVELSSPPVEGARAGESSSESQESERTPNNHGGFDTGGDERAQGRETPVGDSPTGTRPDEVIGGVCGSSHELGSEDGEYILSEGSELTLGRPQPTSVHWKYSRRLVQT